MIIPEALLIAATSINFKKPPLKFWIIFLSLFIISIFSYFRIFDNYELVSYDLRMRLRPPLCQSEDIIIIEISDDTLNNLGKWPLPRDFHASLINVLKGLGAKIIVFDILFSEPTLYDEVFSQAIKDGGRVYLPMAFYLKEESERNHFPPLSNAILGDATSSLKESSFGLGHINVFVDPDGKARRIPLFVRYNDMVFPHLGLKAACDWLGIDSSKVEFKKDKVIINNRLSLPVSISNSFLVNYPDRWVKSFKHLSYFEVLSSYRDMQIGRAPQIDLSIIEDKACFIGLTATGTSDLMPIPLENIYPMLGLQASVFNSVVEERFIKDIGPIFNSIINIIIFLLGLIICLKLHPFKAFFGSFILAVVYFAISTGLFISGGIVTDLSLPLFIIGITYLGSTVYKFLDEAKKRELLEKELDIARKIQKSFLPKEKIGFPGLDTYSFIQPAKFVAGDLYDILPLDNKRLGVFIGDVSGKGVPASLIMAQTVSLFRVFARGGNNPGEVLTQLNKELSSVLQGAFVTALYIVVDTEKRMIDVSCAGHCPIISYSPESDKVSEIMPVSGPPLGVLGSLEYDAFHEPINKGDRFLLYTDGIIEARNRIGQEFGIERIKEIFLRNKTYPAQSSLSILKEELFAFSKGLPQHDDIAMIYFEILK